MNPTQHERIRADLKAFADGELAPLARFFVARHLRGCPSCREELIQMQTLSTELRESETEVPEAPLSSDLRAHILENAPTTDAVPEEIVVRPRRISPRKAIFAAGMAALIAVVLFPTFSRTRENARRSTFSKALDTTDETGSAPPAFSSNAPGVAPAPPMSGDSAAVSSARAGSATDAFKTQNGTDANGMFSDGHIKSRVGTENETSTLANGALRERRGATDELRSVDGAEQQARISVNLDKPTSSDITVVVPATRAVHREGSMAVAVQNAESAGDDAASIVKNAGGFIANTSLETGAGQKRTAVLDCRVPVTQFETVVKKISALGTVRSKSLSGQDITAQVAQSGARRQTLAQELSIAQARLAEKEKSRKTTPYDLYQLRAEVRAIRMQAAQARAALETLQKYGSLSSLYVSLQDGITPPTPHAAGWFDSLSPSTQAAWSAFLTNARLPLQLLMWVLAYSPLWLPALIIWHKYGRKWLTE
ncbi:hypothetical protein IAD21_03944 [Abditibacteriota bacterium]|nr:hypothetical protein IAD21_03944 [Abditibacteriota bacterium]